MRRITKRAVIIAFLGALTTVVVAWGQMVVAWRMPRDISALPWRVSGGPFSQRLYYTMCGVEVCRFSFVKRPTNSQASLLVSPQWMDPWDPLILENDQTLTEINAVSAGWPYLCLAGAELVYGDRGALGHDPARRVAGSWLLRFPASWIGARSGAVGADLPCRPVVDGFATNAVMYSIAWWIAPLGWMWIVHRSRRSQGRCIECSNDLRELPESVATCPACQTPLHPRSWFTDLKVVLPPIAGFLTKLGIAALLGAATTILIAWGDVIAAWRSPRNIRGARAELLSHPLGVCRYYRIFQDEICRLEFGNAAWSVNGIWMNRGTRIVQWPSWLAPWDPARAASDSTLTGIVGYASGWPCLCLSAAQFDYGSRSSAGANAMVTSTTYSGALVLPAWCLDNDSGMPSAVLPCRPIASGFLLDTLVFGAAWLVPIFGAPTWVRYRRRRRGRCIGCGYDLRGLPEAANVCPECGKPSS